ncbi:MAG: efflux RND transporter permease subunit [bacterium]
MKKNNNIIEAALRNKQISLLIAGLLMVFGVIALMVMPRQEFPEFTIRQGLVIGVYPGASSKQVEEQLAKKVENYLFSYKEIKKEKTYSVSKDGMLIVMVELNDNVTNSDQFWSKLKHGLTEFKSTLPPEVLALIGNNDFGDTSVLLLSVESDNKTYKELEDYLELLENELRKNPAVSKLRRYGLQKEQISIYIQDEKLANYGIRPLTVLGALRMESSISYAGEIDNGKYIMPVHMPSRYNTENDVAKQIIYSDPTGSLIRLNDVAKIVREYKEPDSYIKTNGKKCVLLSLEMQTGNNIVSFGEDVDKVINKVSTTLPEGVSINKIANMPQAVKESINNFMFEFLMAIISVIIVTMLLLPLRVSSIAAVTIPISIAITMGVLYAVGIELNTVTLAALIVVLGMVVDNSIVVIDDHVEKLDNKETPWNAAWKSATDLFIPVLTATLAILAAFFPMNLFLTGQTGDFIFTFPITIGIALFSSLLVAMFIVPYLNFRFVKKGLKDHDTDKQEKPTFLDKVQKIYDKTLELAFKFPKRAIIVGVMSVVIAVLLSFVLPRQLFPKVERNQFAVEIYLQDGSSLKETDKIVKFLEKKLMKDKRVTNVTSFTGESSPRFHTTYAPNFPSKNYAQLIVNTDTKNNAYNILDEYHKKYANYFPNAYIRWKQLDMSMFSSPIEIRIMGDSLKSIKSAAERISALFHNVKGVTWVRNDYGDQIEAINLDVDLDMSNRLGFTKSTIGYSVAMGLRGLPVSTIWEGDYPVDIVMMKEEKQKNSVESIKNQYITSPFLVATVPVRQLVKPTPEWEEGAIVRRNGQRTLTIRVDVDRQTLAYSVIGKIRPIIDTMKFDGNININYGGEIESEIESYTPMAISLSVSIVLIFFILLFQFKRIKTAMLIMLTMPLSILGAIVGLLITTYPFGFTSFAGVISLCGMVVRNGILLVDYADELRYNQNVDVKEAAIQAAKRRMRPIFLTSAAAAIGVVPMILGGSSLWGPLGAVVCFGLMFSMVLTLIVLPILYWYFFRNENNLAEQPN